MIVVPVRPQGARLLTPAPSRAASGAEVLLLSTIRAEMVDRPGADQTLLANSQAMLLTPPTASAVATRTGQGRAAQA